jgi:hypothetical protein
MKMRVQANLSLSFVFLLGGLLVGCDELGSVNPSTPAPFVTPTFTPSQWHPSDFIMTVSSSAPGSLPIFSDAEGGLLLPGLDLNRPYLFKITPSHWPAGAAIRYKTLLYSIPGQDWTSEAVASASNQFSLAFSQVGAYRLVISLIDSRQSILIARSYQLTTGCLNNISINADGIQVTPSININGVTSDFNLYDFSAVRAFPSPFPSSTISLFNCRWDISGTGLWLNQTSHCDQTQSQLYSRHQGPVKIGLQVIDRCSQVGIYHKEVQMPSPEASRYPVLGGDRQFFWVQFSPPAIGASSWSRDPRVYSSSQLLGIEYLVAENSHFGYGTNVLTAPPPTLLVGSPPYWKEGVSTESLVSTTNRNDVFKPGLSLSVSPLPYPFPSGSVVPSVLPAPSGTVSSPLPLTASLVILSDYSNALEDSMNTGLSFSSGSNCQVNNFQTQFTGTANGQCNGHPYAVHNFKSWGELDCSVHRSSDLSASPPSMQVSGYFTFKSQITNRETACICHVGCGPGPMPSPSGGPDNSR